MEWSDLVKKPQGNLDKLWLGLAFILVSILSYEAGSIRQSLHEPKPIVIEVPNAVSLPAALERQPTSVSAESATPNSAPAPENCAFVGSRNSNKYHLPASRCARQIKVENRVCFASAEAAVAKGYVAGCLE